MNELFTRMQYEPSILMFGNKYKRLNSTVLDYAWNAIVTTNCDLSLSAVLKNDMRAIVDVIKKDNNDVAELRKWFCHNNDDTLYYHAIRKSKIEKYLDQAFVLATNKPATMDSVQQNDWTVLNFNIESRLDEYLNLMEKAFISWQTSPDKEELISEWVKIQSKALFSDKELIMNVLAEIAEYEILNQGLRNTTPTNMSKVYYSQLEIGG